MRHGHPDSIHPREAVNTLKKTTIISMALTIGTMTAPAVVIAGTQVIKTGQAEYAYPSDVGAYLKSASFVLCADPGCNTPTKKRQYVQRMRQPTAPIKIDAKKIMPQTVAASPPPPPIRETLYFGFDSATLNKNEKQKVEEIKHKAPAATSKAIITGYTDKIGSQSYNDSLALRRAETVNRQLGYGDAIVTGKGKCCYADKSDNARNRRVELVIENKLQRAQAVANQPPHKNMHVDPAPKPVITGVDPRQHTNNNQAKEGERKKP